MNNCEAVKVAFGLSNEAFDIGSLVDKYFAGVNINLCLQYLANERIPLQISLKSVGDNISRPTGPRQYNK
jgi:hypothetical protein